MGSLRVHIYPASWLKQSRDPRRPRPVYISKHNITPKGIDNMGKSVKVLIESGSELKESHCDLFAGIMLSDTGKGFESSLLIAGAANSAGIIEAIRSIKRVEDQLYKILQPLPKELAEAIVMLGKGIDNKQSNKKPEDVMISALMQVLLEQLDEIS